MVLTLSLILFMAIVPTIFKKTGLDLLLQKEKKGVLLFLFSKVLWWVGFMLIANIWLESQLIYGWIILAIGVVTKLYFDRKILFINKKTTKKFKKQKHA